MGALTTAVTGLCTWVFFAVAGKMHRTVLSNTTLTTQLAGADHKPLTSVFTLHCTLYVFCNRYISLKYKRFEDRSGLPGVLMYTQFGLRMFTE